MSVGQTLILPFIRVYPRPSVALCSLLLALIVRTHAAATAPETAISPHYGTEKPFAPRSMKSCGVPWSMRPFPRMRSAESTTQKTLYRLWKSIPIKVGVLWDGVVCFTGHPSYNIHFTDLRRPIRPQIKSGSSFHVA